MPKQFNSSASQKYQQTHWRAVEGLPAYDVPTPSLLDPSEGTPSPNKGKEPSSNGSEGSDIDINIADFLCNEENIDNELDVIVENLDFV